MCSVLVSLFTNTQMIEDSLSALPSYVWNLNRSVCLFWVCIFVQKKKNSFLTIGILKNGVCI